MSQEQIIGIVVAIIAVILVLSFAKKILKLVLSVAVIVMLLIYFGVVDKDTVKDFASLSVEKVQQVQSIASSSDKVKIEQDEQGATNIEVLINDTWYNTKDISKVVSLKDGKCVLKVNGEEVEVNDSTVINLISTIVK